MQGLWNKYIKVKFDATREAEKAGELNPFHCSYKKTVSRNNNQGSNQTYIPIS